MQNHRSRHTTPYHATSTGFSPCWKVHLLFRLEITGKHKLRHELVEKRVVKIKKMDFALGKNRQFKRVLSSYKKRLAKIEKSKDVFEIILDFKRLYWPLVKLAENIKWAKSLILKRRGSSEAARAFDRWTFIVLRSSNKQSCSTSISFCLKMLCSFHVSISKCFALFMIFLMFVRHLLFAFP